MRNTVFKSALYAIQGAIVGVGAILPGVSGGVLCVAFGIYEPMMALFTHPVRSLRAHYKMFVPFLIGWALGFVFLAKGVEVLFSYCPTIALMLFFGLICGTIPELFKASEKSGPDKSWTSFVLTLSLAYLFFHILESGNIATLAPSFINYVLSGLLWGLSLIVPGLSSSSILIFVGLYEPLTAGIGTLDFTVIVPFLLGIGATVLLLSRIVTMLFKKHYALISRIILGFMTASALKIVPSSFESPMVLLLSLGCFALGFAIAFSMDHAKRKGE
ncbi:DUF368 domain-containing protein [Ruthenibacterium lactatiformans]|uniref:DUF368 domain-containing protein n=1 Tax=Ruthenibacterium lactatiformans TaxID=1550024 RepID=UPI003AB81E0C